MIVYKIYDKNINEELKIINSKMNKYKFKVKRIEKESYCITINIKENNNYYTTIIIDQSKIEVYRILCCINTFIRYKD